MADGGKLTDGRGGFRAYKIDWILFFAIVPILGAGLITMNAFSGESVFSASFNVSDDHCFNIILTCNKSIIVIEISTENFYGRMDPKIWNFLKVRS